MKRASLTIILSSILLSSSFAHERKWNIGEFSIVLGYPLTHISGSSLYKYIWGYLWIPTIIEESKISFSSKKAQSINALLSVFLNPNLGFQLGFGHIGQDMPNTASFDFKWISSAEHNEHMDWTGSGELIVTNLNMNLIGKLKFGKLGLFISGGGTLYSNKFNSISYVGVGISDVFWEWNGQNWMLVQDIDAFKINLKIDKNSWNAFGLNIGAGIDLEFFKSIGISFEGRYYNCPKKSFDWTRLEGVYDGIFYGKFQNTEVSSLTKWAKGIISSLTIDPSYFQISAGIKYFF